MSEFDDPALVGLGLALASGLLIGLERGWQQRERPEGHRVAGVRTFALIGLLGGLGGLLAQRWGAGMLIALLVLVGVYLVVGYLVTAHMHAVMGLTTSVAALATFAIGALATSGAWHVSAVAAVVVLALLRFKQLLHAGVGKLSEAEISSGTQLLLISVVVLPVLPDRGFGPYEALNPYRLWWAVVLLAVLSFAGFVLMRSLGRKRGLVFTALLGGIVSSTATTATLARWAGQTPGWRPLAAAGRRSPAQPCLRAWRLSSPSQPPASAGTRWSSSWPWPWLAVFWGRSWRRGRPPTTCPNFSLATHCSCAPRSSSQPSWPR